MSADLLSRYFLYPSRTLPVFIITCKSGLAPCNSPAICESALSAFSSASCESVSSSEELGLCCAPSSGSCDYRLVLVSVGRPRFGILSRRMGKNRRTIREQVNPVDQCYEIFGTDSWGIADKGPILEHTSSTFEPATQRRGLSKLDSHVLEECS